MKKDNIINLAEAKKQADMEKMAFLFDHDETKFEKQLHPESADISSMEKSWNRMVKFSKLLKWEKRAEKKTEQD